MMRRVILNAPFEVETADAPEPAPGPDEFLVRAVATGISPGTEMMWYDGTNPGLRSGRVRYPFCPGYEHAGLVTEIGKNVTKVKKGDRVVSLLPHTEYGALSEGAAYAVLPEEMEAEGAVFCALGGTAVNAVHRAGVQLGEKAVVIGLGVLGTCVGQAARAGGASTVIGVELSAWRRRHACECGFDLALDPRKDDVRGAVEEATEGAGVDVAFEAAGAGANAVSDAMRLVREGGRVVVCGFQTKPFTIDGEVFWDREVSIVPVHAMGEDRVPAGKWLRWDMRGNFLAAWRLIGEGRLTAGRTITHRYRAEEVRDAYEMIRARREDFFQVILTW
ncbi:MAG: zinc-binding dehydrogenase [Planctomycetota bacterium]